MLSMLGLLIDFMHGVTCLLMATGSKKSEISAMVECKKGW